MTFDELKDTVKRLSNKLDGIQITDPDLLNQRIQLRELRDELDVVELPQMPAQSVDIDVKALMTAVDQDIALEKNRSQVIGQIGKLVGFAKSLIA